MCERDTQLHSLRRSLACELATTRELADDAKKRERRIRNIDATLAACGADAA